MKRFLKNSGILFLLLLSVSNLFAQWDTHNCEIVGGWFSGPTYAAFVDSTKDTLAFMGDRGYLRILNVSDPSNPTTVGEIKCPSIIQGIYVKDFLAYVADGEDGLRIIDVTDPTNPEEIGFYDTESISYDVQVVDSLAYVANGMDGLRIINVSDPTNPEEIGFCDTWSDEALQVYVVDNLAYVAADSDDLRIVNVVDPTNPEEVGSYGRLYYAVCDVQVVDSLAYLMTSGPSPGGKLSIVDISDPTNVEEIGSCDLSEDYSLRVHVVDSLAYVVGEDNPLNIINVSDPTNPKKTFFYGIGDDARSIQVVDSLAYIASMTNGLRIISVADPTNAFEVGYYDRADYVKDVYVVDSLAYVADGNYLKIIDFSSLSNPTLLGELEVSAINDICVKDSLAYIGTHHNFFRIINVADPTDPQEIGIFRGWGTLGLIHGVYVTDSLAYLATHANGVRIINVSDPTNPGEIGYYYAGGGTGDVHVVDSLAYVANGTFTGLLILNVSDPTNPVLINQFTEFYPTTVQVIDSLAYIGGIHILNVSDPINPVVIGSYDIGSGTVDIHVVDSFAYFANSSNGLYIINVSDPTNPLEIGSYDTEGSAQGVYAVDSLAYVVDYLYGLYIVKYNGPVPAVPEINLSSNEHDFGVLNIGQHSDWNLTISNFVNIDLRVDSINIESDVFYVIAAPAFPQTFRDSSIEVLVRFSTSSQASKYVDTLFIYSNDPDERVLEVSLTGVSELVLRTMYPNPFKPYKGHTSLNFSNVPSEGEILVYSLSGEKLWHHKVSSIGTYYWDGIIDSGEKISSGFYYYLIKDAEGEILKKGKFSVIR